MAKVFRWLARSDFIWLDRVTETDEDWGLTPFRFSRWPGDPHEPRLPWLIVCNSVVYHTINDAYYTRIKSESGTGEDDDHLPAAVVKLIGDWRRVWVDDSLHEFVIHSDVAENRLRADSQLDALQVLLRPPTMWGVLQPTIFTRLYCYYPQSRWRFPLGEVNESSLDRMRHSTAERRARETLRRIVGERHYRSYLKNGYISVRAPSGKIYGLTGGKRHMPVWGGTPGADGRLRNYRVVDHVCLELTDSYCHTDQLLARYMELTGNEETFSLRSHHFGKLERWNDIRPRRRYHVDIRPLTELARNVREVATSLRPVAERLAEIRDERLKKKTRKNRFKDMLERRRLRQKRLRRAAKLRLLAAEKAEREAIAKNALRAPPAEATEVVEVTEVVEATEVVEVVEQPEPAADEGVEAEGLGGEVGGDVEGDPGGITAGELAAVVETGEPLPEEFVDQVAEDRELFEVGMEIFAHDIQEPGGALAMALSTIRERPGQPLEQAIPTQAHTDTIDAMQMTLDLMHESQPGGVVVTERLHEAMMGMLESRR